MASADAVLKRINSPFFSNPRNVGKSFSSLSLRGSCKRGLHTPPPLPLVENLEFSGTWFVVRTPWWWTHKTGGPTFSTNRFVTILDTHLIGFQTSILLSDWQRMASGRATAGKKKKKDNSVGETANYPSEGSRLSFWPSATAPRSIKDVLTGPTWLLEWKADCLLDGATWRSRKGG